MTNPRIPLLEAKRENWKDLPEETTPVERESLRALEKRVIEWIFEGEAGVRKAVTKTSELEVAPYTESYNENGDLVYVAELNSIYTWSSSKKEWRSIVGEYWRSPVTSKSELSSIEHPVNGQIVFVTHTQKFYYYDFAKTEWVVVPASQFRGTYTELSEVVEPEAGDTAISTTDRRLYFYTTEWKVVENTTIQNPTWAVEVVSAGTLGGPFFRLAEAADKSWKETKQFKELEAVVAKGEVTVKILKNGTALKFEGGGTTIKVKEEAKAFKFEKTETLTNKDHLQIELSSPEAGTEILSLTLFIEDSVV